MQYIVIRKGTFITFDTRMNLSENQSTIEIECQRIYGQWRMPDATVRLWRGMRSLVRRKIGTVIAIMGRVGVNLQTKAMELIAEKVEFNR